MRFARRVWLASVLALWLSVDPARGAGGGSLASLLPADCTLCVEIPQVQALAQRLAGTALGEALKTPEARQALGWSEEESHLAALLQPWASRLGWEANPLVEQLEGEAVFAVLSPGQPDAANKQDRRASWLLLAKVRNREEALKTLEGRGLPLAERPQADWMGETVYLPSPAPKGAQALPRVCWALLGDTLMVGFPRTTVEAAIAARHGTQSRASLVEKPLYQRAAVRAAAADVRFVLQADAWVSNWEAAIDRLPDARGRPLAPIPAEIKGSLALDSWEGIWGSLELDAAGARAEANIVLRHGGGALGWLLSCLSPPDTPAWLPPGPCAAASLGLDVVAVWDGLGERLRRVAPAWGAFLDGQIALVREQTGVDVRRQLLGRLGPSFVLAWGPPEESPRSGPSLMVWPLSDAASFEMDLASLWRTAAGNGPSPFEEADFSGRRMYQMRGGGTAYAVADGRWLLSPGSADGVKAALQVIDRPDDSFWEQPAVRRLRREIPPSAVAYACADLTRVAPAWLRSAIARREEALPAEGNPESDSQNTPAPGKDTPPLPSPQTQTTPLLGWSAAWARPSADGLQLCILIPNTP